LVDHEHVGYRYVWWGHHIQPGLTAEQKARAHEAFAVEFESLPRGQEPFEEWGETMAYLCRRIARRHRGEPVGEWVPTWERRHSDHNGDHDGDPKPHSCEYH
jgi:hypothetical protein